MEIKNLIKENAEIFEISKSIKNYYKNYKSEIIIDSQKSFFLNHIKFTDDLIILIYNHILKKHLILNNLSSDLIPVSLVALGSYGREQLCLYSDIDILILYEEIPEFNISNVLNLIENFISFAWDCGLELGSKVIHINEIKETVHKDQTIKTSLLESRYIYGSKDLYKTFEITLNDIRKTNQKEFILEKFQEHALRLKKYPLNMQANIKDGYGGIREANMLWWISNVLFGVKKVKELEEKKFNKDDYRKYKQALDFIFLTRNTLHFISQKRVDIINFDILPQLSSQLGFTDKTYYSKERLCSAKVFSSLHIIHKFSSTILRKISRTALFEKENLKKLKEFRYKKNRYIIDNKLFCSFSSKPKSLYYLIKELCELPSNVKEFDESFIYYASKTPICKVQSKELKKTIKTLLYKKEISHIMFLLYDAGLFQYVFPSAKKIINQPQFDGYHIHPVDIHSLYSLKFCENIEDDFIKSIYENLSSEQKTIAKIVSFFHDIGKGRKKDHHIVGEHLLKNMLVFFGFENEFIKIATNLTRYHNMMSYTASREDIFLEKTILNFIGLFKSIDEIKILYVVTYSDICAVNKSLFNSSNQILLKQLFNESLLAFENKELIKQSYKRVSKLNAIKNLEKYQKLNPSLKRKINQISSNQIFLRLKSIDILDIAIKANSVESYIFKIINDDFLKIRIIRKKPLNLGYLLGKLQYLNMTNMDIFKLYDDKKAFEISFLKPALDEEMYLIEEIINDSFDMQKEVSLKKPIIKRSDIKIDCKHSSSLASMYINTKDQKGLFAYIAKILDDFNIEIESAKLYTSKGYAKDLLLIEKNGNFCSNTEILLDLITTS